MRKNMIFKLGNKGISLISLIVTIIVIIILATISIFTGLETPYSANFAKYTNEFSDFKLAVTNTYIEKFTDNTRNNKIKSDAQIYYEIAIGRDVDENEIPIAVDTVEKLEGVLNVHPEDLIGKEYYEIVDDTNVKGWKKQAKYYEAAEKHYVTDEGDVFFLPGYPVEEAGTTKWWISENKYYISKTPLRGVDSIEVNNVKITTDGTTEAGSNLELGSTTLYINFEAPEGATVSPSLPYVATENGAYNFTITTTEGKTRKYTITVSNFREETLADTLKIGDYVDYIPVTASNNYKTNPVKNSKLYTGVESKIIERTENTKWRVIKSDKKTGEVLITPTDAVNIAELQLYGAPGFINYIDILNDICEKLYSNTELGVKARSIGIEDLGYSLIDGTERYAYYPNDTPEEYFLDVEYPKGSGIMYTATRHGTTTRAPYNECVLWEYDHIYSDNQKATYSIEVDGNTYNYEYAKPIAVEENGEMKYYPVLSYDRNWDFIILDGWDTETVAKVESYIGTKSSWLASSTVNANATYADFGVIRVSSSGIYASGLANSYGSASSSSQGLRPVVSLGTTLKVDMDDTSRDGESPETAWKIIKKH